MNNRINASAVFPEESLQGELCVKSIPHITPKTITPHIDPMCHSLDWTGRNYQNISDLIRSILWALELIIDEGIHATVVTHAIARRQVKHMLYYEIDFTGVIDETFCSISIDMSSPKPVNYFSTATSTSIALWVEMTDYELQQLLSSSKKCEPRYRNKMTSVLKYGTGAHKYYQTVPLNLRITSEKWNNVQLNSLCDYFQVAIGNVFLGHLLASLNSRFTKKTNPLTDINDYTPEKLFADDQNKSATKKKKNDSVVSGSVENNFFWARRPSDNIQIIFATAPVPKVLKRFVQLPNSGSQARVFDFWGRNRFPA